MVFIHSMGSGGAERVTANLANCWAGKGWEITVVTLAPRDQDFYELHPAVRRIAFDLAGHSRNALVGLAQNLRRVFALRQILRLICPDVALGLTTGVNVVLALAAWRVPGVCAIGAERTHPPQSPLRGIWTWLRRNSYGRLTAVVALTGKSADWIKEHTAARRVRVIPNPVVWPLMQGDPHLDVSAVCKPRRKVLLVVGRLCEEKQIGPCIECFRHLAGTYAEWDLVVLGEGPLRAILQGQVVAGNLQDRVFLPGRAGNIGDWYARADVYVLPSRFEGFPNALLEAMAHGLPSVSFDCDTGPRDIVRHQVDGLLVPPGDFQALISALGNLMADVALRQRLGARAIEVRERFAIEAISGMWESLFQEGRQ